VLSADYGADEAFTRNQDLKSPTASPDSYRILVGVDKHSRSSFFLGDAGVFSR
jgi:hypothetical protein